MPAVRSIQCKSEEQTGVERRGARRFRFYDIYKAVFPRACRLDLATNPSRCPPTGLKGLPVRPAGSAARPGTGGCGGGCVCRRPLPSCCAGRPAVPSLRAPRHCGHPLALLSNALFGPPPGRSLFWLDLELFWRGGRASEMAKWAVSPCTWCGIRRSVGQNPPFQNRASTGKQRVEILLLIRRIPWVGD
jgi:hypothetical protein